MDEPTSFDHVVAILGIAPGEFKDSLALKEWVRQNRHDKYVPTELLRYWGFEEEEAA